MITVASAVEQIISRSDFAIEGLQTGCLNMSEYAKTIMAEVESITKKPVQKGSIIVAISRLGRKYYRKQDLRRFQLYNLVSRTGLTELSYPKSAKIQTLVASLYGLDYVREVPFFVSTVGLNEISIVTQTDLVARLLGVLEGIHPTLHLDSLASLTMQVDIKTIDMPRQSYTVIKQLALRDITIVEYITSPTELTIILYESDLKQAFSILYDKFFAQDTR